ncbi:geranylgeranyl transferase type2 beta subunit, putative [Plasmodium knowlesi strain H]|uniref:Geranylgeranyl transferase type II subunit beta n=3 Tax=Plasmodium knowlesi TaxID=5850 RepID=A0A1A7VHC4_PLAKH|nr:geranylgeranyl transferase type-2 subunit beta, putative [Plasmodium knowlesi strain H]OTN64260.1 putative Geranylgeranyl transferase type2 beta subunit [Plasmodium knowlesi]CAA9990935.1 geranylgeranyl transferase type-2 subunit beta, putative [Plasmodium knowlesi strain H]SBO20843.1 geranylgeranyl transferase type2 beta subunit, putative [Plasmodium knowlesi strain H]SBO21264.1 geranylgeranyl transferase type2 beta subunit, putative [Plasmodium knowlesi strain H]VVS80409.1 geranylgeranyl t
MDLDLNLHEKYFLNTIKEKLAKNTPDTSVSSKYESIFISGIFWVLSGLTIVRKNRKSLDEVLDRKVIDTLYSLVMECLEKKKIKKKYIYKLKKEKYFLSNEDIDQIIGESQSGPSGLYAVTCSRGEDRGLPTRCKNVPTGHKKMCDEKAILTEERNAEFIASPECSNRVEGEESNKMVKMTSVGKRKKKRFHLCGFSPCKKSNLYEANVISTLSAIQVLFLLNKISEEDISTKMILEMYNFVYFLFDEKKGFYHFSLNNAKFQFDGDIRFMFCALSVLHFLSLLLKKRNVHISLYNNDERCAHWILTCLNLDGGFSNVPGSESHAGTTFCAINSLKLLRLRGGENYLSNNGLLRGKLIRWLCDRYDNFGINGRIGKDHDVCYAWWVLGSLVALKTNLTELFNVKILITFILMCQDKEKGGFSRTAIKNNVSGNKPFNFYDRENLSHQEADLFHTFFALCAISLIYHNFCHYKKKNRKRFQLFGGDVIPQQLESTLAQMVNVHVSFAMPLRMTYSAPFPVADCVCDR